MIRKLRNMLNRLGYDLHRIEADGPPIDVLSLVLRESMRTSTELFVLQIGANDGITGDPICDLIRANRLPSLLVEPLPDAFSRLQSTYSDQPQVILENCAVAETDGVKPLWRVVGNTIPQWASQWASFEQGVVERHCQMLHCPHQIESLQVPTLTISSLLKKHAISSINLLQIDTEGYEDRILELVFNAQQFPQIISYEHAHLSTDRRNRAMKLVTEHAYKTCRSGRDTIAVLSNNGDGVAYND